MNRRKLFLDVEEVTRIDRLHRTMHQPTRHPGNPVVRGEHPWESVASLYGTVMYDPEMERLRMWYLTGPCADGMVTVRGRKALGNITLLGYAESDDGIEWRKPMLGQLEFEGSRENNLIDIGRTNCEGAAVLYDPRDPDSERRYKAFYWEHGGTDTFMTHEDGRLLWGEGEGDGMWVSVSPDGITWTNLPTNPVIPHGSDTTQSLVWDERLRKYVVFGRMGSGGRRVGRAESDDCEHFSESLLSFSYDETDEEGTQFYGMPVDIYEGLYIGFVWVYREGVDGTIDTSLAVSRDGIRWQRVLDRQTFLSLGLDGSWEDGMARITQNIIRRGDTLYLYYGGVEGPHTGRKFKRVKRKSGSMIGLATLRRDGFVSLDAGEQEGSMLSKPFSIQGSSLHVNADSQHGYLRASITDDTGRAIDPYISSRVRADSLDMKVAFPKSVAALSGREVRVRFDMKNASLYSYWIKEE